MGSVNHTKPQTHSLIGSLLVAAAFLIWGLSPVYWKTLVEVPAFEILMHRIVWSFLFILPFLLMRRQKDEFMSIIKKPLILLPLMVTTLFVSCNWFIYIWAINHAKVIETSLGYYINPLGMIILGMVFLREQLRPLQILALLIAASGVLYLTLGYGEFPWIALSLAFTFGFYGLIRKIAPVGALAGLLVETLILSLPALIYLLYLESAGTGTFIRAGLKVSILLMGSSLLTALPLLLFTMGAKRIDYSTSGFLQYFVPSCTFLLAVFVYHEPVSKEKIFTFIMIWIALGIYTVDSVYNYGHRR